MQTVKIINTLNPVLQIQEHILDVKLREINVIRTLLQQQIKNQSKILSDSNSQEFYINTSKVRKLFKDIKKCLQIFDQMKVDIQNKLVKYSEYLNQNMKQISQLYVKKIKEIQIDRNNIRLQLQQQLQLNYSAHLQIKQLKQLIERQEIYKQSLKMPSTSFQQKNTIQNQIQSLQQIQSIQKQKIQTQSQNRIPPHQISCRSPAIQYPPVKIGLQTIIEQQEVTPNLTPNIKNMQLKKINKNTIFIKTQPNQVEYRSQYNQANLTSERKQSLLKAKARFYIQDFRKMVQKTNSFDQNKEDKFSKTLKIGKQKDQLSISQISLKSNLSNKSKNSTLKYTINEMCIPSRKQAKANFKGFDQDFLQKQQNQIYAKIQSHLKRNIIQLGGRRHSQISIQKKKSNSKQKIKITQKQNYLSHKSIDNIKSFSRQKINITLKDQNINQLYNKPKAQYDNKQKTKSSSVSIFSNSKQFKLFLQELEKIDIYLGDKKTQQRFEGTKKDGMRDGKGKLYYVNGFIYEGEFKENLRHGLGLLHLNGKQIYKGRWQKDKLNGTGSLKNFQLINKKKISQNSIIRNLIYNGQFYENKFHGIGTMILGQQQKLCWNFMNGIPAFTSQYINNQNMNSEYKRGKLNFY